LAICWPTHARRVASITVLLSSVSAATGHFVVVRKNRDLVLRGRDVSLEQQGIRACSAVARAPA
jgi:hypothetical protein